ncbi:MAG: transcriptional regulator [Gammaproteobacteria bacterium]|jgi:DNA-binding phage protein
MTLPCRFRETVQDRAQADARFRCALLTEAVSEMLSGDLAVGKTLLRDYVNATLGFERLAAEVDRPVKSLQRMLGPSGNPTAGNLIAILKVLQEHEAVQIKVKLHKDAA